MQAFFPTSHNKVSPCRYPLGMTSEKVTGRDSDKIMLRVPDGMRDRIAEVAKANGRSMNAEIVARLQGSFEGSGSVAEANEKLAIAGFVFKLLQKVIPDEAMKADIGTMLKYLEADKAQEDGLEAMNAFSRMQNNAAEHGKD